MSEFPRNKAQITDNPFQSVTCEIFGCRNVAKHFIGRPDGPLSLMLNVCDDCLQDILDSVKCKTEPEPEQEASVEMAPCKYCGKEFKAKGVSAHERQCKFNPANTGL